MMVTSVTNIVAAFDDISTEDVCGSDVDRLQLVSAARRLIHKLETVQEKTYATVFEQPNSFAALMTCVNLEIFEKWTTEGGGEISLDELLKLCKQDCESNLLRRLLRLLCASGYIREAGEDRYKPTPFSLALGDPSSLVAQSVRCREYLLGPASTNLPSFLEKTSYREPQDAQHTSYSDFDAENKLFFEACVAHPQIQTAFSGFMTLWAEYKVPWPTYYDTQALVEGADLSRAPLVVDLGGHHGIDLLRVLDKHPELPAGSLVLQDLPAVVAGAGPEVKDNDRFRVMPHDIFERQPVVGARAYFAHAVFHDWPHGKAVEILRNVAPAMRRGYSKLLICDIVIPPTGSTAAQATMDVGMMANLSACERTETVWRRLIAEAGFDVVKMWKDPRGYETLIEAELA